MEKITKEEVEAMSYVQLLAQLDEVNRPPGGKDSVRRLVQNTFLRPDSSVLDVGCNSGYCTFEIAHLAKCSVTGVDISPEMIAAANRSKENDSHRAHITFQVADGMNLPFSDNTFDLTMSGGSTAFIDDKVKALKEYARVTKEWGFVGDINFFYRTTPPQEMINELNATMGINIQPWDKSYWLDVYKKCGLETYYTYSAGVYVPTTKEVHDYAETMANSIEATDDARTLIAERLEKIMSLFAKNHEYLDYSVFILRKRETPEQIALFGS